MPEAPPVTIITLLLKSIAAPEAIIADCDGSERLG
jgi:hypothetical protein